MPRKKRDYQAERKYDGKPEVKARRAAANRARRKMENKLGRKLDGDEHVDHKKPRSKGGSNALSNLRVVSAKKNVSYARNKDGSIKSKRSKKS